MSFQTMTWAVEQKTENAGQKLVLLMLANHTNGHTGQCNPSHRLLAEECCMGVSTLKNHLVRLEELGFIKVQHRFNDGVSLPNQYFLKVEGVGQNLARGRSESDGGVGQNLATNQEDKPGKRTKTIRISSESTLDQWLSTLNGQAPIPADSSVLKFATAAGIPHEYIKLAWAKFKEDMIAKQKTQKDWRLTFTTYVKNDYLRLWFFNNNKECQLTTSGKQLMQAYYGEAA
jgi:hypothetical protein